MIAAIGDIHGRFDALSCLLQRIMPILQSRDLLVFLGDYIDRGPDTRQVVDALLNLETEAEVVFLMGNHEELALNAKAGFSPEIGPEGVRLARDDPAREWFSQGGAETLASYGLDLATVSDDLYLAWRDAIPTEHWQFLQHGRLEHTRAPWHFVHAGVLPVGGPMWEFLGMGLDPHLWVREPFLSWDGSFEGRRVVFGHTPQESELPLVLPNKIGIDTGAAWGDPLTAALLGEKGEVHGFLQSAQGRVLELTPQGALPDL